MFAETEVAYSGKTIDLLPKVRQVVQELKHQGLQKAILLPSRVSGKQISLSDIPEWCVLMASFRDILKGTECTRKVPYSLRSWR